MGTPVIRAEGLTRSFGELRAVDGLHLEIAAGTVFGFLGPNGAGKTTSIRLLLGILEASAGRAEVLGFDARTQGQQIRERVGALLEHHGLYERLSAAENLEFYGRAFGMSGADRRARIKQLLEHFGLWDRRDDLAGTFSRGMKQKLAVARALLHRPAVVFLDEPTAGVDPEARVAFRRDLQSLVTQEGMTVFLTTHDLVEAEKVCNVVGIIRKGRLLELGAPGALREKGTPPRLELVGQGFSDALIAQVRAVPEVVRAERSGEGLVVFLQRGAAVPPLVSVVVRAGAEVSEARRSEGSLEDVYLSVMERAS